MADNTYMGVDITEQPPIEYNKIADSRGYGERSFKDDPQMQEFLRMLMSYQEDELMDVFDPYNHRRAPRPADYDGKDNDSAKRFAMQTLMNRILGDQFRDGGER